jgi:small subunit ribosomal protein S25e
MPGKKSMKKQEKQQASKDKEDTKTKAKREKIIGSIDIPDANSEEVMSSLQKMKAITSTGVATQFNLKISVANKMLKELENEGILTLAAKSHNLKVYAIPQD